jgi:hypothetical protein
LSTIQAQIDETTEDGVQEVDRGTILKLWTKFAGGRTHGGVYGIIDLFVKLRRGSTSFTSTSQKCQGSMYEMSLEAKRAERVRAEDTAVRAKHKADDALAQSQLAIDLNKELMSQMVELKTIYLWSASIVQVTDRVVSLNLFHILIMIISWTTNQCIATPDLSCFRVVFSTITTFFGRVYFVGNLL